MPTVQLDLCHQHRHRFRFHDPTSQLFRYQARILRLGATLELRTISGCFPLPLSCIGLFQARILEHTVPRCEKA